MSEIANFYNGKSVLITGATGFLGIGLTIKLLRSCPGIKSVYLLIRQQKDQGLNERFEALCESKAFKGLQKKQPDFRTKLVPVQVDMREPGLGIDRHVSEVLANEVNIVFHSAASVRFDEPLRSAIDSNVLIVQRMAELCKTFKAVKAFIHISTLYSNLNQPVVEEKVYPSYLELSSLLETLRTCSDEDIERLTSKIIATWNSTYFFTKHLAEQIVAKELGDIPVAIIRPPAISSAVKEPFPTFGDCNVSKYKCSGIKGWLLNYGAWGLGMLAVDNGSVKVFRGKESTKIPVIPIDYCVNTTLAAGWHTAIFKPQSPKVYNSVAEGTQPLTLDTMLRLSEDQFDVRPGSNPPTVTMVQNRFLNQAAVCALEYIPALISDCHSKWYGQPARALKQYYFLQMMRNAMGDLAVTHFLWSHGNVDELIAELCPVDREIFYMDTSDLDWPSHIDTYYDSLKALKDRKM